MTKCFGQLVVNETFSNICLRVFPVLWLFEKKYTTIVGTITLNVISFYFVFIYVIVCWVFLLFFFFCYQDLIILFTSALYLILAKMLNMLKAEFKYSFSFSVLELIWPGKMHVQKILKRIRMSMTTRKRNKCVTYDFRFCKEVSWS